MVGQWWERKVGRREFLGMAALWSAAVALGGAVLGILRLPSPVVSPEASRRIKIGRPDHIPIGDVREISIINALVHHDAEGFYAVSKVCTHLGCIVNAQPNGFICPCHGSEFRDDGQVVKGPAPKALPWLKMELAPDGQLVVDASRTVRSGQRLRLKG